jgi:hypothetical protein
MTKFLDPLDSAFILLENPGTSMNIGAIVELEARNEDPTARFEDLKSNIAARIHEIPVLTQRVVRAPFDMTWPIPGGGRSIRPRSSRRACRLARSRNGRPVRRLSRSFSRAPLVPHAPPLAAPGHRGSRGRSRSRPIAEGASRAGRRGLRSLRPSPASSTSPRGARSADGAIDVVDANRIGRTTSLGLLVKEFGRRRRVPNCS